MTTKMATKNGWIRKWKVPGSSDTVWTVSVKASGEYGCSCPRWKFKREECKHILAVKGNPDGFSEEEQQDPMATYEAWYRGMQASGYRYHTFFSGSHSDKWDLEKIKILKLEGLIADYKTKGVGLYDRRVVMVKNTPLFYIQKWEAWIAKVKRTNFRKRRVKNPYAISPWRCSSMSQAQLRQDLKEEHDELVQLILFNKSGDINPNLPKPVFWGLNAEMLRFRKSKYGRAIKKAA